MLKSSIAPKNNSVHKQISVCKQNLILNIFPTALRYAEVHFRCVLCGYRRVRRSPHSDHRVGTHRGYVGHLHQHYLKLLRPLINAMEIFVTTAILARIRPDGETSQWRYIPSATFCMQINTRETHKSCSCKDANRSTCAMRKGKDIADVIVFIPFF
jgi:hypothetical protein